MSSFLPTVLKLPFVQNLVRNQLSTVAAAAAGYVAAHGDSAGYSPTQITGAVICVLAIALQAAENALSKPAAPAPASVQSQAK